MSTKIVIAGASGFVGQALIQRLLNLGNNTLIGLSRTTENLIENKNLKYISCDLFSLRDAEEALLGAEIGVYLVHSMSPTASLDQGSFQDYDLILADNFARAAKKNGLKQIIYLSGIIPGEAEVSEHLTSRLEVEQILASYDIPVVSLRCGMIVGNGGSSATILMKIVNRLPILFCPPWAKVLSQPIDVENVIDAIVHFTKSLTSKTVHYDLGGPDILTYRQMLERIASVLGQRKIIIDVPFAMFFFIKLATRWISGAPKNLVNPLVGSLRHRVVADPMHKLVVNNQRLIPFDESIRKALAQGCLNTKPAVYSLHREIAKRHIVRSVQRMPLPPSMKADSVAFAYQYWLQNFLRPFLKITKTSNLVHFNFMKLGHPLLKLELSYQRSTPDRQLFYIRGGLLAQESSRGRLEFREVLNGKYLIAAIHDFKPRMPWWIYTTTQAPIHLFVMLSFSRWLLRAKKSQSTNIASSKAKASSGLNLQSKIAS